MHAMGVITVGGRSASAWTVVRAAARSIAPARLLVAAERATVVLGRAECLPMSGRPYPQGSARPPFHGTARKGRAVWHREEASTELVRGRLQAWVRSPRGTGRYPVRFPADIDVALLTWKAKASYCGRKSQLTEAVGETGMV